MTNLGKLIYDLRIKNNLSQGQLAKLLGYKTGQYISNIERGTCGLPPHKIKLAAAILKVDSKVIRCAIIQDFNEYLRSF